MKASKKTKIATVLFILPSLLGITIFRIVPYTVCFVNSLFSGDRFVGFSNYADVVTNPAFLLALRNTLILMCTGIPLLLIISLLLSLFLNSFNKIKMFFQSSLLIPVVVPVASLICIWQLFFEDNGIINGILNHLGLGRVEFFGGSFSMVMIILIYIWKNCGFCVIIFSAGIANVPKAVYESAKLDGASSLKLVTKITLPLITPTTFFAFLFAVLYSNNIFREVFVLFGDYPESSVYLLQNFINNNYYGMNYCHLSSASIIFSLLIILVLLLFFAYERKRSFLE